MVDNDRTASFSAGNGRIGVLLCHGFTGSPASMRDWAEDLADAGYRVSLPRLPGHGTVWQEMALTSWQDWYDRVDAEYRALSSECDRVFVAGLSMGGALALRLAEQHPDVAGLMLVNPAILHKSWKQSLVGVLKHFVKAVEGIGNDIAREGVDEGSYDWTPVASVHQMHKLWSDVRSCLDLVTCPLILFQSLSDHVVPGAPSEAILRNVSSTDVTHHLLENSYHVATLDYDRHLIFDESRKFIERILDSLEEDVPPRRAAF